jgi:hypothetical protein
MNTYIWQSSPSPSRIGHGLARRLGVRCASAGRRGWYHRGMPTCRECNNEVETLKGVKVSGKTKKMCEDCADRLVAEGEIAEQSESVVQDMMGFKGRR